MKIAFMGSDPIALPMLDFIRGQQPGGCILDCLFTQPDRRTGRGMHEHANAIKQWGLERELPVYQPVRCGDDEADLLAAREIELVLVMAYGQILPRRILGVPSQGFLNIHASLLPRLRGASPIHTAMAVGLEETGISLMQIVPKLDAGPVADQEKVPIDAGDDIAGLLDKLSQACVPLIDRNFSKLAHESLVFHEQDPDLVSYCRILEKTDRYLDFNRKVDEILNHIRAFQPWPGTSFPVSDIEVRIHSARKDLSPTASVQPGYVRLDAGELAIACGDAWLKPIVMQRPGGKPMPAADFLRGFPIEQGTVIESREMRPLESATPFPYRKK